MAQVLNTLAHEIRTPLAVSQGYLKLYVDGRLASPDDQRRALQQTREALGVIAVLCAEMTKVGALAEAPSPALVQRLDTQVLVRDLAAAGELAGATWETALASTAYIATNAPADLLRAIAVTIKSAFDEDTSAPHAVAIDGAHDWVVIRAGTPAATSALPAAPHEPGAAAVDVVRGGKGLSLIWATFVLDQHGIQTWHHPDYKASVGLRIPLVTV